MNDYIKALHHGAKAQQCTQHPVQVAGQQS